MSLGQVKMEASEGAARSQVGAGRRVMCCTGSEDAAGWPKKEDKEKEQVREGYIRVLVFSLLLR